MVQRCQPSISPNVHPFSPKNVRFIFCPGGVLGQVSFCFHLLKTPLRCGNGRGATWTLAGCVILPAGPPVQATASDWKSSPASNPAAPVSRHGPPPTPPPTPREGEGGDSVVPNSNLSPDHAVTWSPAKSPRVMCVVSFNTPDKRWVGGVDLLEG